MDLLLDAEQRRFRDEVRTFLDERLTDELRDGQSRTIGVYPEPDLSLAWQRILLEKGWAAPTWPTKFGGTGWSPLERFIFENECAQAGAPLVYPIGMRLVAPVLMEFGSPEQQQRWLPQILSGEDYWCQGFSEPGAGSDLASLRTRATREGDSYRINGSKMWTTHAHHANRMFALVRTAETERPQQGISFVVIDLHQPGVDIRPIISIGGDHDVNQVFLTDVVIPADNLIGEENHGWTYAKYLLEFERGTGLFSGRLRASLRRAEAALNGPPSAHQQRLIAEVAMELDVFEMFELSVVGTLPNGGAPGPVSSVLKLRASRLKQTVSQLGVALLGADGVRRVPGSTEDVLITDYLNARAATIFGGAAEVQLGIIAKALGEL
ncbi:acyl-CoA dehydrogenase [Novosphingobium sp. ERN07]|uniref:acyl-CoA dehydrogenase family protein n=1 Tax=Novosphingobium sp. ERN07 TaxID=2726187 RepID=UPI0014573E91|nr:acyl-CoA dehydrogenase family protein [Novosphingobium sp. ERN07]NLR73209.1 acyl-CoA dehydrogenase [Novosphingobium sp. ERN07]